MKILIVGVNGQLGSELVRQARQYNAAIQTPTRAQMDITTISQPKDVITKFHPAVVINAAAYTDVDGAETDTEVAFTTNTSGPANLARCCCEHKIPLIHISTDFVFDGQKREPYLEDDSIGPLGIYGLSKAEGEEKIRSTLAEHLIVRTSWLYGVYGHNFVKTILKLGQQKNVLRVVNDQYGSPTSAADLAAAVLHIASGLPKRTAIPWGTYHYSGKGITTWHEFAENILAMAKPYAPIRTTRVQPITTDEYPTKAKRPAFSALDCRRIAKRFGIHPKPWPQSLKATIKRIFSEIYPNEHECD
jgi:dTDP-4-dehydrorhamnose reductase